MSGPRFFAFRPLGSRAQREIDTLVLAEAYKWDPHSIRRLPSSERHRYIKMKEQITREQNAKSRGQTTVPQPTLPTGISPRASAPTPTVGVDYSSGQ